MQLDYFFHSDIYQANSSIVNKFNLPHFDSPSYFGTGLIFQTNPNTITDKSILLNIHLNSLYDVLIVKNLEDLLSLMNNSLLNSYLTKFGKTTKMGDKYIKPYVLNNGYKAIKSNQDQIIVIFDKSIIESVKSLESAPTNFRPDSVLVPRQLESTIAISATTHDFGEVVDDSISSSFSYIVSGTQLINNIIVTAPTDFIINTNNSNSNQSPITLLQSSGTVASTTIYAKFAPTTVNTFTGNITHTSTNATVKNLAVSGESAPNWQNGLSLYWPLNSNATDSIGSNNGTATNISYVAGKVGNAADFNGTSKISFGSMPLNASTDFSLCFWIKLPADNVRKHIFFVGNAAATGRGLLLYKTTARKVRLSVTHNTGTLTEGPLSTTDIATAAWVHVGVTYGSNTAKIYVNGQVENSVNIGALNIDSSGPKLLGISDESVDLDFDGMTDGYTNARFVIGQIDEFRIWNSREISAVEMLYIYNAEV